MSTDRNLTIQVMQSFRDRLLDLTKRNNLISLKYPKNSSRLLRIVDISMSELLEAITDIDQNYILKALPDQNSVPEDEQNDVFINRIEELKLIDTEYQQKIDELGSDPSDRAITNVENWLRDKLRLEMGLSEVNRKMALSAQDHAKTLNINPSYELSLSSENTKGLNSIQTLLYSEKLERVCKKISSDCKMYENEAGISVLFMALGSLCWYESDDSEKLIRSPLLLIPVELKKTKVKNVFNYSIQRRDDPITLNLSLKEKMKREFGIELPVVENEEEENLIEIFDKIEKIIENRIGWTVEKTATISFFSFTKLSMYHDLSLDKWGEHEFRRGSLIESLINGRDLSSLDHSVDYNDLDNRVINKEIPITITDADSSQMSAILDILAGKDLVIQGPPGTGKSQTITNIIAAALERGKKVLFIAEKKAALEVVKSRLDKAGLKEFCLELHSNKTKRVEIAKSFQESYELRKRKRALTDISNEIKTLQESRDKIRSYVELINTNCEKIEGYSYQKCIWKVTRLRDKLQNIEDILASAQSLNVSLIASDFSNVLELLQDIFRMGDGPYLDVTSFEDHVFANYFLRKNDIHSYDNFTNQLIGLGSAINSVEPSFLQAVESDLSILSINDIESWNRSLKEMDVRISLDIFENIMNIAPSDRSDLESLCSKISLIKSTFDSVSSLDFHIGLHTESQSMVLPCREITSDLGRIERNGLESFLSKLESKHSVVSFLKEASLNVCKNTTLPNPQSLSEVLIIRDLVSMLKTASIDNFLYVSKGILEEIEPDYFDRVYRELKELNSLEVSLKNMFSDELMSLSSCEVKQLVETYKTTNVWMRFSKRYRKAKKKIFNGITSFNLKRNYVLVCLDDLCRFIYARDFLANDPFLNKFLNTSSISQANVERVQCERQIALEVLGLTRRSEFGKKVLSSFLNNSSDMIDSIKTHDYAEFYSLCRTAEDSIFDKYDEPLDSITSALEVDINCVEQILQYVTHFQVYDHCTISDLYLFDERLKSLREMLPEIESRTRLYGFDFMRKNFNDFEEFIDSVSAPKNISHSDLVLTHLKSDGFIDFSSSKYLGLLKYIKLFCEVNVFLREWSDEGHYLSLLELNQSHKIIDHFQTMFDSRDELLPYIQSVQSYSSLNAYGLRHFLNLVESKKYHFEQAVMALELILFNDAVEELYKKHPRMRLVRGEKLDDLRARYKNSDIQISTLQRQRLKYVLAQSQIELGISSGRVRDYSEMGFINHQINLNSRHAPIRDYFIKAPVSTLALKPCLMMSPLSISQYLPAGKLKFDLVVMDEASQLKPEDALGAILRAKQVVVVGDPKQLPPTSFFNFSNDDEHDDEDLDDKMSYESILDMALTSFRPARMLKWHYRSKHETLIKQSNEMFYDGDLIIFPSPHFEDENFGFKFDYVENGEYQSRRNVVEAKRVLEHIEEHVKVFPSRSLGIVTMNKDQQELITDLFDRAVKYSPELQNFVAKFENSLEPLIIKNLENIQGDERDVIIVSTLYGRAPGASKFHQRFGPINHKMGHRRLNVLFTRSRFKTLVVSSLDPDYIVVQESSNEGVKAFKKFLQYARSKKVEEDVFSLGTPDSDFEQFVMSAISSHGYKVHAQIGVSGYKIDLGVLHPTIPGKYILGIECDGATYHSSKYARDRDKIRQEILESLGWKIHRIWSTDWFTNKDREVTRLIDAIKKSLSWMDSSR